MFLKPRTYKRHGGIFGRNYLKPMQNLNDLAKSIHQQNIKWWQDPATGKPIERNRGELLMLIVSELAEAMEGERKNLVDDHLPHRKMAEVEMADAYIRILDFCGGFGLTLPSLEPITLFWLPDNKGEALLRICAVVVDASIKSKEHMAYRLADLLSYIASYCTKHGYDLEGAMTQKLAYNRTRKDHTHEARQLAGGKKF